jgi:hypothetical protein
MNEQAKPNDQPPAGEPSRESGPKQRPAWIPIVALLVAFLVGFVPMWLKSGRLSRELSSTQSQLQLEQIQMTFANAALDARRGEYEAARKGMANLFNFLTAEIERGTASVLPPAARDSLQPLLAQRDDLITLLARSDAASAERLGNAYAEFRKTLVK